MTIEDPRLSTARGLRWPSAGGMLFYMSTDVTRILSAIEQGDPSAAEVRTRLSLPAKQPDA